MSDKITIKERIIKMFRRKPQTRAQLTTWTTKDGRKLLISKMTDTHLVNTINFLVRRAGAYHANAIASGYQALSFVRGDMATLSVEQELQALEDGDPMDCLPEEFDIMGEEANRRGLIDVR